MDLQDLDFENENLSGDQQNQLLFMMLVQQHQQIAMMGMGKIKNPSTDKVEREMKSAKFAIDTLLMLKDFTEGNLPKELKNYLNQTLNNLRMNYAEEREKDDEKIRPEDGEGEQE
ncbi:MAG: DUF1844 domain-containing protein [Balneolaceae bacterium]|nr:DUF1844 domain-containing protein [Balneolaceae bacterium]